MNARTNETRQAVRELAITRVFDAPRERVFQAWIDPQQLKQWWSPKYFTNPVCEVDARPGGAIRIDMQGPDGNVYPMTGQFLEIAAPERLVMMTQALDGEGRPILEVLNTVTFEAEGAKTRLTLKAVVTRATPEATFALAGMDQGWNESLDKLAELFKA